MKRLLFPEIIAPIVVVALGICVITMRINHIRRIRGPEVVTVLTNNTVTKIKIATRDKDFILSSETAVSNATFFSSPPDGWDIVCDDEGNFAPRFGALIMATKDDPAMHGYRNGTIRTSRWEAVVAAWRVKEIWDTPREPVESRLSLTNNWRLCDK